MYECSCLSMAVDKIKISFLFCKKKKKRRAELGAIGRIFPRHCPEVLIFLKFLMMIIQLYVKIIQIPPKNKI